MEEIWKEYGSTKNCVCEFSDHGRMRKNGKLVKFKENQAYYTIKLDYIHRIIAKLFVPNPENKPCVDHINGDTHDNRAENLRWCTYYENNHNPITVQRQKEARKRPETIAKYRANKIGFEHSNETKQYLSDLAIDRKHMTNGIDRVFPKPEEFQYYLDLGYRFGRK